MTPSLPTDDPGNQTDGSATAALDSDAAPATGREPDTAGPAAATEPDVVAGSDAGPDPAVDALLAGPAQENDEMRRGTEDLQSSQVKIAQAREFAEDVARSTEPEPAARPGDES